MRWCFKDGSDSDLIYAEKILDHLSSTVFLVPNLWHLEAANVLARAYRREWLTRLKMHEFLDLVSQLPLKVDQETAKKTMTE